MQYFSYKCIYFRYYADRQFADMHKVEGLNGVYIATKLVNASAPLSISSDIKKVTMISFNKGGDWKYLPAPSTKNDFYCMVGCWQVAYIYVF